MGGALQMQARFVSLLRCHRIHTFMPAPSASTHAAIIPDVPTSRDSTRSKIYPLTNLIKACGDEMDLSQGKKLHAEAQEGGLASHAFVASAIICMYGKCGGLFEAEGAFCAVSQPDVVLCNSMLAAYVRLEQVEKTLFLFHEMNAKGLAAVLLTYVSALQACGILAQKENFQSIGGQSTRQKCLEVGRALHSEARTKGFTQDVRINTALVCMYARCHSLPEAENVFSFSTDTVVSWNAMLSAYVEKGFVEMCLWLYRKMEILRISPDHITIVVILQACRVLAEKEGAASVLVGSSKDAALEIGQALHAVARSRSLVGSVYVGTTLVNLYGKCDSIRDAEEAFHAMTSRTVVSWNAMLSAYIELGHFERALLLFRQMQKEGVTPDQRSVVSALHACGSLMKRERAVEKGQASLSPIAEMGRCFHALVRNTLGFVL